MKHPDDYCRICDAWPVETTGAARVGGGYHRRCPKGHEWDDPWFSYMRHERFWKQVKQLEQAAGMAAMIEPSARPFRLRWWRR